MYVAKVKITGDKIMKRFLTIALALAMMLTVCAFALELDTAEAADEVSVTDEAVLSSAVIDPANEVHATYGELVYYQNFEAKNLQPTYIAPEVLENSTGSWNFKFVNCNGSYTTDPVNPESGNTVCLIAGNGTSGYARIEASPKLKNCYGLYTVVMDYYYTSSDGKARNIDFMPYLNGTQKTNRFDSYDKVGQWNQNAKGKIQFSIVASGDEKVASFTGSELTHIYLLINTGKAATTDLLYIDNVKIYRQRKVKINYNYGILPESIASTKAVNGYFVPGAALPTHTALGYHFLGWTLDSTPGEDSELITTAPDEDTTVYAVWRKYRPGINPMTGTSAAIDFEDGNTHKIVINYSGHKETVVDNSVENAGNAEGAVVNTTKVLKSTGGYTSGTASAYRSLFIPVGFEKGRKYELQYDVFFTDINSYMTTWQYSVFTSAGTPTAIANVDKTLPNNAPWMTNNKDGKWYHLKYTFQPSLDYADKIYFQQKTYSDWVGSPEHTAIYDKSVGADGKAVYTLKEGVTNEQLAAAQKTHATRCIQPIYYDNVSYLPYYMVTFYNADGSVSTTDQVLRDASGNLLASYTIPSSKTLAHTDTKQFMGWSTEKDATVPMTSVALENEDIALYPVYGDYYKVNYHNADGEVVKTANAAAGAFTPDYALADGDGKHFKGWKLKDTNELVTSITVTGDVDLVPVYTTENAVIYVSSNGNDTTGDGTEDAPYATLSTAYSMIDNGVVFVLLDNTTFVNPPAHNGALTIKGASSSVTLTLPSEISLAGKLKLDNLTLTTGTFYANGYTLEISSSVTSTGNLAVYGGTNGKAYTGNTDVKIYGGTYSKVFGGSNNAAVNGETSVTFGGNANVEYIFGAGNSTNGTAKVTNVYVNGGNIVEAIYGGSHFATAENNGAVYNVTMTGGKTQAIFGGNIGSSVNGNVFVKLLGGEVTRRVYTGCYNETSGTVSISFKTDYYVTGTTVLTIAPGPSLVTGSYTNRGIFSGSRTASQHDAEQNTIIYLDGCYNTYSGKIGEQGWIGQSSFKSHHDYVVQATAGGDVLGTKTAGKVYIAPDEGKWGVIGTETYCDEEAPVSASTSITFENYYTVTYYGFDGEVLNSEDVLAGEYALDFVLEDVNGKYFEGWALEGTEEAVTSVNVTADVNIYPVYVDKTEAFENVEGNEMRFDGENATASIRFKSVITAEEKNAADEFGFIVTRKTFLDAMASKAENGEEVETDLTFDFVYGENVLFVSGVAYQKDENGNVTTEKIVDETADGDSVFATVLTDIKNDDADQVNETMVVRPYVKFTNNGKQFTFYGATAENSLVGVAKTVDTTELPENVKASIEAIVALEK